MLVGLVFWAGYTVGSPAAAPQEEKKQTTATVTNGTIEHKLVLTTSVSRQPRPLTVNPLGGYVVSVNEGSTADQGNELYRVGNTPVFAVVGSTPFWRDLEPGHTGPDVAQLNKMLVDSGHLAAPGQSFTQATSAAMKAFLADHNAPYSGAIPLGQLIAIAAPHTPIMIDSTLLYPGAKLNGGEQLVSVLAGDPTFDLVVTPTQASMIPPGTQVRIHHGDLAWEGVVGASSPTDEGVKLEINSADGKVICGAECDKLPPDAQISLLTDVILVPPATGLTVPVAALNTHADGSTTVTRLNDGNAESVPVTVKGVSGGLAVIEGVNEGDTVAFAEESEQGS